MSQCYKLLLVDDDASQVRLLQTIIERSFAQRIELTAMTESVEVRGWLETHQPDIVITDLEMPGASGLEILRMVKRRHPLAQVLLFTGHSSTTALLDALEFGAIDYLLKPLDSTELLNLLEQSCERVERWQRALLSTMRTRRVESVA
jgi:DNA-binding NtrC family response regulator